MNFNEILDTVTNKEVYELTTNLVNIPSYTGLINQELAVARYIKEFFESGEEGILFGLLFVKVFFACFFQRAGKYRAKVQMHVSTFRREAEHVLVIESPWTGAEGD